MTPACPLPWHWSWQVTWLYQVQHSQESGSAHPPAWAGAGVLGKEQLCLSAGVHWYTWGWGQTSGGTGILQEPSTALSVQPGISEALCCNLHAFSGSALERAAVAEDLAHRVRESWKFLECW